MDADAWATALIVMEPDRAVQVGPGAGTGYPDHSSQQDQGFSEIMTSGIRSDRQQRNDPRWRVKLFILSTVAFGLALLGMSLGVIFGKSRIRGSCGGASGLRDAEGNPLCEGCATPKPDCTRAGREQSSTE